MSLCITNIATFLITILQFRQCKKEMEEENLAAVVFCNAPAGLIMGSASILRTRLFCLRVGVLRRPCTDVQLWNAL